MDIYEIRGSKRERHDDEGETNRKVNHRIPEIYVVIAADAQVKNRNVSGEISWKKLKRKSR